VLYLLFIYLFFDFTKAYLYVVHMSFLKYLFLPKTMIPEWNLMNRQVVKF